MKLSIKQFCELKGIDVDIPCEIIGDNATGKTSIKRAFEFVMLMNDSKTGKGFDNRIYPESPKYSADLLADVTFFHDEVTLRRVATPTSAQINHFHPDEVVNFSLSNVYYVNGKVVGEKDYQEAVMRLTGGCKAQDLCDLNAFFEKNNNEIRKFFVDLAEVAEFDASELKLVGTKIDEIKRQIDRKNAIIQENNAEIDRNRVLLESTPNKAANIELVKANIAKYQAEIDRLNDSIQKCIVSLSAEEIDKNNSIYAKIGEIEREKLDVQAPKLILKEKIDVENVKSALKNAENDLKNAEFGNFEPNGKILSQINQIEKTLQTLEYTRDNYMDLLENEKCTKCAFCNHLCENKQSDLINFDDLCKEIEEKINELDSIKSLNQQDKIIFEAQKSAKINSLNEKINNLNKEIAEIETKNAEIESENAANRKKYDEELNEYNSTIAERTSQFESDKAARIEALKEMIIVPVQKDTTEITTERDNVNALIRDSLATLRELEELQKANARIKAVIANRGESNEKIQSEIEDLQSQLFKNEKIQSEMKQEQDEYYVDLESEVNAIVPASFHVQLFEKTITTGEYKDTFKLTFNDKKNLSNANEMLMKVSFLRWFQEIKKANLPIFVDEFANVTSKEIRYEIKSLGCVVITPKADTPLTII